ncbi:hypothetical protein CDAR_591691 [Caerostris darwini]|uniref:Uncharacterized protein n=1 Tax=Caerostris darwini TaxID=1538125 RepID=A0AAV4PI11_9ARAC|nr:hypothetical protein CDAR_591691 [Caerostris darwini]
MAKSHLIKGAKKLTRLSSDVKQKILGLGPANRDKKNSIETRGTFKGTDKKTRCVEWSRITRNCLGYYCVQNHDQNFFLGQDYSLDQQKYKEELIDHEDTIEKIKGKIESLGLITNCPTHYCNANNTLTQNHPKKFYAELILKPAKMRLNHEDSFQKPNKRHTIRSSTLSEKSFRLLIQNKFDNICEAKGHVALWKGFPKFPKVQPRRGKNIAKGTYQNSTVFKSNYITSSKTFAQMLSGTPLLVTIKILPPTSKLRKSQLTHLTFLLRWLYFPTLMKTLPRLKTLPKP